MAAPTNDAYVKHDATCDCELVMDDYFAGVRTLEVHICEALQLYDDLSIGCTDQMQIDALEAVWRKLKDHGSPTGDARRPSRKGAGT